VFLRVRSADANAGPAMRGAERGGWIEIASRRIIQRDSLFQLDCAHLFNYFLRGLVVVAPVALTIYVCVVIFTTIDSWLHLPIPAYRVPESCSP
jgi:hypothetical protein